MRQKLGDLTRPLCRQPRQHIFKIGIRIMPVHARRLDQTHDRNRSFTAAQRPGNPTEGKHRNEPSRACLQSQTNDEHLWHRWAD